MKKILSVDAETNAEVDLSGSTIAEGRKLKFPSDGWTLLCDITPHSHRLKFTLAGAIDYFHGRRAADGLAHK